MIILITLTYGDIVVFLKHTPVSIVLNLLKASTAEAVTGSSLDSMCTTKCYDTRADNKEITYTHSRGTAAQSDSVSIKKGISLAGYIFAEETGCIVSGQKFSVCLDGSYMNVSFIHSDTKTYTVNAPLPLYRWASYSISINPNYMTIFIRNRDDGVITKGAYDFSYNPIDSDNTGFTPYVVDFTLGGLQKGQYTVHFEKPFSAGTNPFCLEEVGLCDFALTSVILDPYKTESGRYNISLSHFDNMNKTSGISTCSWYDDAGAEYKCQNNSAGLLTNTSSNLQDGITGGYFYKGSKTLNGVTLYDRFGILQTEPGQSPETYGIEFNGSDFTWNKLGFTRGGFTINFDQFLLGKEALQPVSYNSKRETDFGSYTFSGNWLWKSAGAANLPCSTGTDIVASDGCWDSKKLCNSGDVELYSSHPGQCFYYTENASCFEQDTTKVGTGCYNFLGTPNQCPNDGRSYQSIVNSSNGYNSGCKSVYQASETTPVCSNGGSFVNGMCKKIMGDLCSVGYKGANGQCESTTVKTENCTASNTDTTQSMNCMDKSTTSLCDTITNTAACQMGTTYTTQESTCNGSATSWSNNTTVQGYFCGEITAQSQCPNNYTYSNGKCTTTKSKNTPFSSSVENGSCTNQSGATITGTIIYNGSCDSAKQYTFTKSYNIGGDVCASPSQYAPVSVDDCSCSLLGGTPPSACSFAYKCNKGSSCSSPSAGCSYLYNKCTGEDFFYQQEGCSYRCPTSSMVCPLGIDLACDTSGNCSTNKYSCPLGQFDCKTIGTDITCTMPKTECPVPGYYCDTNSQCSVTSTITSFTCPLSASIPCDSNGTCTSAASNSVAFNCNGTPDYSSGKCINYQQPSCPGGTTFSSVTNSCVSCSDPNWPLDVATGMCVHEVSSCKIHDWSCKAESTAQCVFPGQILDSNTGACKESVGINCLSSQTYSSTDGKCYDSYLKDVDPLTLLPLPCQTGFTEIGYSMPDPTNPSNTVIVTYCIKAGMDICNADHVYDAATNRCIKTMGSACGTGEIYDNQTGKCIYYADAECNSGTKMKTPATAQGSDMGNRAYSGCYSQSVYNWGQFTCRNGDTLSNGRCYEGKGATCEGSGYSLVHGTVNEYDEWTGTCWNKTQTICPQGSVYAPGVKGEHSNSDGCLIPSVETSGMGTLGASTMAQTLCNEVSFKREGDNFSACTAKTTIPNVITYESQSSTMQCPLSGNSSTCSQVGGEVFLCGSDKICAGCFNQGQKGQNLSPYADISAIKVFGNYISGYAKNKYLYSDVKSKLALMTGARLPKTNTEAAALKTLWKLDVSVELWVENEIPEECKSDSSGADCLKHKKNLIVIWENAANANFVNICVYDNKGNAICTADMQECSGNICPINAAYPCVYYHDDTHDGDYCSETQCASLADPTISPGATETTGSKTKYEGNDGYNSEGDCEGSFKIFNGKATRCRDKQNGSNDCCECENKCVSNESTGSSLTKLSAIYQVGKAIYTAASIGVATYTAATTGATTGSLGAAGTSALSNAGFTVVTTTATTTGATITTTAAYTGITTTTPALLSSSIVEGSTAILEGGGQCLAATGSQIAGAATTSSLTSSLTAFLNPTSIAIAVIVYIVTTYLMKNCDTEDMTTVAMKGSYRGYSDGHGVSQNPPETNNGLCHYVGSYCESKIPLLGCWNTARKYCCFNSKMSRIIQEQVRWNKDGGENGAYGPLLSKFSTLTNNGWGEPKNPDCNGFSPNEFAMIDFSKIDMSEYYSSEFQNTSSTSSSDATKSTTTNIDQNVADIETSKNSGTVDDTTNGSTGTETIGGHSTGQMQGIGVTVVPSQP